MKQLNIQFDIDTLTCIEEGVSRLLLWARREQLKLSFFVNMGRSIDLKLSLKKALFNRLKADHISPVASEKTAKMPIKEKLGLRNVFRTLLLNPKIGANNLRILDTIIEEGHELGLHGGNNHALWQHGLHLMSSNEVLEGIQSNLDLLECRYGKKIIGFCAPGFVYEDRVLNILKELGFMYFVEPYYGRYRSDVGDASIAVCHGLFRVPINIIAERTVPFIENACARDITTKELVAPLGADNAADRLHIYGHPCFEGINGLDMLTEFVQQLGAEYKTETITTSVGHHCLDRRECE